MFSEAPPTHHSTPVTGSRRITPHLISNNAFKPYAHILGLGVLNAAMSTLKAQMTTCIISMVDGEHFAHTSGVGVFKSLAVPLRV
jgi:hypothetical protein